MEQLKPCPMGQWNYPSELPTHKESEIVDCVVIVKGVKTGIVRVEDTEYRYGEWDISNAWNLIAWNRRVQAANSRFSDCHIWEAGDKLNTISDKCEVLITAEDIKALMAQPANEPLTLDELREMDGKPVWAIGKRSLGTEVNGWMLVSATSSRPAALDFTGVCNLDSYGKTWIAYRTKPEEATP